MTRTLSTAPAPYDSTRSMSVHQSVEETTALLKECPAAYRTGINELLLSAVYWAVRLDENAKVEFVLRNRSASNGGPDEITAFAGRIMGRYWYNDSFGGRVRS